MNSTAEADMAVCDFRTYTVETPTYDGVAAQYAKIQEAFDAARDGDAAAAALDQWDRLRRRLATWTAVAQIRFQQDTRDATAKAAREYCDELQPRLINLAVAFKGHIMASPHRAALATRLGPQLFELWNGDLAAFDPAIESDLVEQAKVDATYTELLASPKFNFQGEQLTLSQITKFAEHPERQVRFDAAKLHWNWFGDNCEQLDAIFTQLVGIRQSMADKLGFENYIPVGYHNMHRIDYDQAMVEAFRAEVRKDVVPLSIEIRRRQAKLLGVDPLMAWDQAIFDPAGNPKPQGDHDWMVARATEMFADLGHGMDGFFAKMRSRHLMDLKSRDGKAGGGFCEILPDFGMPFIYANFNGSKGDVEVFTHEMGHAFQAYMSVDKPVIDYIWPTTEACEIHSMGLEFLTWPQMDLFFGDAAERFRRVHLTTSLLFLPYGAAVDHFQHLVYANPAATASDRAEMWQEMERTYLPWLDWGELAHPASGRRWQAQRHIYNVPFYYIDYTLALTCALQLWVVAATGRDAAMAAYIALCKRGGEAPFGELVRSAGLTSPFQPGCLAGVVAQAKNYLG